MALDLCATESGRESASHRLKSEYAPDGRGFGDTSRGLVQLSIYLQPSVSRQLTAASQQTSLHRSPLLKSGRLFKEGPIQ